MPTFDAIVEFKARCQRCGNDLVADTERLRGMDYVIVAPCETCLDTIRDEAHAVGFDDAKEAPDA